MKTTTKQRLAAAAVAAAAVTGTVTAGAGPAEAATTGYIYISVPSWLGNCPNGGSVIGAYGVVDVMGQQRDYGDDLVYVRARIGDYNTITAQAYCSSSWQYPIPYWGPASQYRVYINRSGETVWQGPAGVRHN
jgi:hypothetical protein